MENTAKEWYENSKYQYCLAEHDEGGYLGINENKVADMLEEYHQAKLKNIGVIGDVSESVLCQDCFKPVDKRDNWCKHCGEVIV
ncbi:hypothetical protein OAT93_01585 [bacterium]|nr:hypothetical protein [bacterium]